MWIAEARKRTSKNWKNVDITWDQFLARIRQPLRTGETVREYRAMGKDEKDFAKESNGGFVGGFIKGGQRKTENVTERSMITIDCDSATDKDWVKFTCLHDDIAVAMYSTHSHTKNHPRYRWVIPTSRAMAPDEYPAISRMVASWIGMETVDHTTHEVARLFYWPSCPKDGDYVFESQEGELLNPDDVLALYGPQNQWKDTSLWPISPKENEIRLTAKERLGDPSTKNGMIGLFCRTYDVPTAIAEFIPDIYTHCGGDRYTFTGGTTSGGAIVYNDGQFLYSNHATDPAGGQSCNAFDLVRIHRFGQMDEVNDTEDTKVTDLPSYKAMTQWCSELPDVKKQMAKERTESVNSDFMDLTNTGESLDWTTNLQVNPKTGECLPTIENALLILLNDENLKGKIGYDLFANRPKALDKLPWNKEEIPPLKKRGWTDTDESGLRLYMEMKWQYVGKDKINDALQLAMLQNSFHPVKNYLNSLKWDGNRRLDTLFIDYMGADDCAYVRSATRKWMAGAVARVMNPGCKMDSAIILVGNQGLGKSTFAQKIAKNAWYNDSEIKMGDKDGYQSLQGCWIIELAELASVKRAEVETVKTFISKSVDTYRPSFGKNLVDSPRQCVFFGTTNEMEFLRDRTGNRRFWPIQVETFGDMDKLETEVDQIWAEAVEVWKNGEKLWITDAEEKRQWGEIADRHTVQDEMQGQIMEFLDIPITEDWEDLTPETRRDYIQGDLPGVARGDVVRNSISIVEVKVEMLSIPRNKCDNDLVSRRIANILNTCGWHKSERKRKIRQYGTQWVYTRYKDEEDSLVKELIENKKKTADNLDYLD